jgi:hypothetical protein
MVSYPGKIKKAMEAPRFHGLNICNTLLRE